MTNVRRILMVGPRLMRFFIMSLFLFRAFLGLSGSALSFVGGTLFLLGRLFVLAASGEAEKNQRDFEAPSLMRISTRKKKAAKKAR